MGTRNAKTYCRICEAHCGLEVEVDEAERVVQIRPDRDHPVSRGFACVKGTRLGGLHHDPDRLDVPLERVGDRFEPVSWARAIGEIGRRVRAIKREHGPRAIAMYTGNPTFFSFQNLLFSGAFLEALGSPNLFASHSIDVNNKFEVSTRMYGRSLVQPVPDLDHLELLICLGTNPAVSQMSVVHVGDAMGKLQAIEARGGEVVIVDPRRTETARRVGRHLFIRPGTDVFLLLAMLHVLAREGLLELDRARRVARGVDDLVALGRDWDPPRVSGLTGIPAEELERLARRFAAADGAALYMSVGINMGPFGSLCHWLVQALNLLTGNLDRRGGLLVPDGAFPALELAGLIGVGGVDEHRTLAHGWHRVAGAFPASALADEIELDHPERIRALFVSAGNPVRSVPGGGRLERALERLDLLVGIDIYPNESTRQADFLLPATDMLERSDFAASHTLLQVEPHAQYTPAVVKPLGERRPEWRIFSELAVACGAPALGTTACNLLPRLNRWLSRLPGAREIEPDDLLALLFRWGVKVTLRELRANPSGVRLPDTRPGSFLGKRVATRDGRVDLWPERLVADLPRLRARARELEMRDRASDGRLALIGRRARRSHNSWMHNQPQLRQPLENLASLHPEEGARLGVRTGDRVEISSSEGRIEIAVELTEDVMPGVVVVPHGWGERTASLGRAHALGGADVNRVVPGGQAHMEPVSGQAIMVGHPVAVRPVGAAST